MEDYPPVSLNPPPTSLQKHDTPLGSSSASPAHAYQPSFQFRRRYQDISNGPPTSASLGEDEGSRGQDLSDFPSTSQQAALALLHNYDNGTIFAWLTGLRSFRPGRKNWFQPGCLAPQQLKAISALKDCTDGLASAWLDCVRSGRSFDALHDYHRSGHSTIQSAAQTSTCNTWQGSSDTSSSFGSPASPYGSRTTSSTQSSSGSRRNFPGVSQEPSIDETAATLSIAGAHTHWCFVCEHPRIYTTCDGWKRHMKEHETRYPCMPQGRERHTAHGPECVLCGVSNPDEKHYDAHNILPCSNKTLVARSYTRKSHLVNHLKIHGITDGFALAEQWRDTLDKKYFSCGFCIACFHSHTDQLNHIDSAHYKKHQHINEWEYRKIILGLLLQPEVQESWQKVLKQHPQCSDSGFCWNPATAKSLQLRLEKGEETANHLALAAFNESTYDWMPRTRVSPMPVAGFSNQDMNICDYTIPTVPPQAIPAQTFFNPNQSPAYDGGMMNTPYQTQYTPRRPIAGSNFSPGVLNANPTADQKNSSQGLMVTDRPQNFHDMQLEISPCNSNHWARPQSPSNVPYDGSDSISSDAHGGQTASLSSLVANWNWQFSSFPKLLAGHSGHVHNRNLERTWTTGANQAASLGLNHPPSPLTQATSLPRRNSPLALPARPTTQPSRNKLKDYYDIDTVADMDINLDDIQYLMREEEHTRSERRRA